MAGGIALLVLAAAVWPAAEPEATAAPVGADPAPSSGARFFGQGAVSPGLPEQTGRRERLRLLTEQFLHADHTYCSYASNTKYPVASRPASEHTDQLYPNQPVVETGPLRAEDGRVQDANVLLQTSQSRVYMVAGEVVTFSLRALDQHGAVLPIVVTRAVAQGLTFGTARPGARVSLPFADDGALADPVAGDGHFAGQLSPAQTSLASFNGTIRTEVRYSAGGRAGVVVFDVIYSPEVPATWTGQVKEVIDDGSLAYILQANVRQPGRYIVSGRVDDAGGKPFALATFNGMLGPGSNEVRLTVFGKLLHDKAPAMPLTLRDVDGYLLKENTDPDRALMPRLEGTVIAGRAHPLGRFSDAEWQGEERTRHLAEFARDVDRAGKELAAFDPTLPMPASQCHGSTRKTAPHREPMLIPSNKPLN